MANARTPPKRGAAVAPESPPLEPLEIDRPEDGEVIEFEARIRVTSRQKDPYGLRRLQKLAPLLNTSDIHVDGLRYVIPVDEIPDSRARDLVAEADELRRRSDASRRRAAEVLGRHRNRPRIHGSWDDAEGD